MCNGGNLKIISETMSTTAYILKYITMSTCSSPNINTANYTSGVQIDHAGGGGH